MSIRLVECFALVGLACAALELNPFLTNATTKQTVQQFQVVVLPPGAPAPGGDRPPSPGYVWVQVPVSNTSPSSPAPDSPSMPASATAPAALVPGVQQPASPTQAPPAGDSLLGLCLKPRGQFPGRFCNAYINCWDGVAVEQFCPETLVFNPKGGYCDYDSNVDCESKPIQGLLPSSLPPSSTGGYVTSTTITPTSAPPPPNTPPPVDPNLRRNCLKPRGQFRSDTCNKYVNCWDDVIVEQECPEGLLFSTKGYCDYPGNVNCSEQTSTNVPKIQHETKMQSKECPVSVGTFRDKTNCSHYFTCLSGNVVAHYECPTGFSFNDYLGVCDYSERVDCSKEPIYFSPSFANFLKTIPEDLMDQINGCTPGSVFRLNPQCTSVCLCREGVSEIVQCPNGSVYDLKSDKCLPPHLAKC